MIFRGNQISRFSKPTLEPCRKLHLIHPLTRVPVEECLAAEHGRELLGNALEHLLDRAWIFLETFQMPFWACLKNLKITKIFEKNLLGMPLGPAGRPPEPPQTKSSSRPISDPRMFKKAMNSKGFADFRLLFGHFLPQRAGPAGPAGRPVAALQSLPILKNRDFF